MAKWLIKVPGHIPILFASFLELPKVDQIWPLTPLISHKKHFEKTRKMPKHFSKKHYFHILTHSGYVKKTTFWKGRAPQNDEGSSKKILETLDMRPISVRNHEWNFANMVPISTTKYK